MKIYEFSISEMGYEYEKVFDLPEIVTSFDGDSLNGYCTNFIAATNDIENFTEKVKELVVKQYDRDGKEYPATSIYNINFSLIWEG